MEKEKVVLTEEEVLNLKLWASESITDMEYTEGAKDGEWSYTKIKAIYQIYRATKKWGSIGSTWGVKDVVFNNFPIGETVTVIKKDNKDITNTVILLMCNYTATFYYPGGQFPVEASIQITFAEGKVDKYYSKSVATDALTKGLSKLGFSADIYMQKYDKSNTAKSNEPKKEELKSYTKADLNKSAVDPLDSKEVSEAVDVTNNKKAVVKNTKNTKKAKTLNQTPEPVTPKYEKDFIIAINARKDFTQSKKDRLLNDENITKIIKQEFVKTGKGL